MNFSTLQVSKPFAGVVHVELARPKQGNAMNHAFWGEMRDCFDALASDPECRAIVLSAQGRFFSVGLDIKGGLDLGSADGGKSDVARSAWRMRQTVHRCQDAFTAMENCPKPVIACVHSAAIGGAIDLMCCADIRLCSKDAWFTIKEVDVGLAADVGTLQRLHHVVGNNSIARELCYTARRMESSEAERIGFVSRVHESRDEMLKAGLEMAKVIATKSPVAIAGTKINLNFSREHTVKDSLEYIAIWNASMLQTEDVMKSAMAGMAKQPLPEFSKL